jgi:hypothetical protein
MRVAFGLAMAAVLGFGLAGLLRAEPLDLKQVAADAKWVAHVDVDAMRHSTVLQKAHEQMLKKHPEAEKHLAKVREIWKFNPCTDIHGATFYDTQIKKGSGIAIVHAKVDRRLMLEKAKQAPEHRAVNYGKYELHSWTHDKGSKHQRSMTGTFYKPDVLVFGNSVEAVMAALDVLDGTKPNIAGKDGPLAAKVLPGAMFVARAVGLSQADLPCKSPLAKQVDTLTMAAGENHGESYFKGRLGVKQPEIAQQMKAVADGFLAVAALTHGSDADAMKLIGALKVTAADKTLSVEWRAPADAVWAHVQKMGEKMRQMEKK